MGGVHPFAAERPVADVVRFVRERGEVFAEFFTQDSGCLSVGVRSGTHRWFVKWATTPGAAGGLRRARAVHRAVRHPTIVPLVAEFPTLQGPALVFPWVDGEHLYHSAWFYEHVPIADALRAVDALLDAHVAISAAGFVAVDLYDGCFLYEPGPGAIRLFDLDEYRPGPFTLEDDRTPGSTRFMAPEEWQRGALIGERTTVHLLGRAALVLAGDGSGDPETWRGPAVLRDVVVRASAPDPADRHQSVDALARDWRAPLPNS